MGIPCFLGGMTRGLLGRNSSIQFRHCRKDALKEADVVLLIGLIFLSKLLIDINIGFFQELSVIFVLAMVKFFQENRRSLLLTEIHLVYTK